jgi:uncharacterized Fe-S cluster-containing protein
VKANEGERSRVKEAMKEIANLLPGYNCGECGLRSCREFAAALVDVEGLSRCPILKQEKFKDRRKVGNLAVTEKQEIIGVLTACVQILLPSPLPGEPLREDLYPFDRGRLHQEIFNTGPCGCP